MAGRKVLIPFNFTANDEKALDFVIRKFASDSDVTVTLFNAYTPVPEVQVRNNPIMDKMSANLSYLKQKVRDREEELRETRNRLIQEGFTGDRVDYIFKPLKKDVAREVVDLARKDRFDVVVLNRNPANIKRFFTASVAERVNRDLKDIEVAVIV